MILNAKYKIKANLGCLPVLKEINEQKLILLSVLHIIIFTETTICLDNDPWPNKKFMFYAVNPSLFVNHNSPYREW